MRLRLWAGLAIALALSGCGIGRRGVLDLSWTAPTQNTDGSPVSDIALYRVYYGTTPTPCPGPTYITVPNPPGGAGQQVTARLTKLAVGEVYYVSVAAVSSTGEQSTCSTAASNKAHSTD